MGRISQFGYLLLCLLLLTACDQKQGLSQKPAPYPGLGKPNPRFIPPYDYWYFNFVYPYALPADVTYVKWLDTDGFLHIHRTTDGTQGLTKSVGRWVHPIGGHNQSFNKGHAMPVKMRFCWDSIIDKKVYQTTLIFPRWLWERMLVPVNPQGDLSNSTNYRDVIIIGLAPQGKVRAWLSVHEKNDLLITTVNSQSGEELTMCKGITGSKFTYRYPFDGYTQQTIDFIKDKKYPYGEW